MLNSINEKCARIRGAFLGEFDDYMAKSYYKMYAYRGEEGGPASGFSDLGIGRCMMADVM